MKPLSSLCALVVLILLSHCLFAQTLDVVIAHGRVMDPESHLDAVRNVGIRAGKVVAITSKPLHAKTEIDATGLVVAPGFVDSNEHGFDAENYRLITRDGVTTALDLEGGPDDGDIDRWYEEKQGKSSVNFGTSVNHPHARMAAMEGDNVFDVRGAAAHSAATPSQLSKILNILDRGLSRGALGIGYGLQYTPGASREEVVEAFRVAAKHGSTNFVHLRYGSIEEPDSTLNALEEVIASSAITGARLHIVHIGTSGLNKGVEYGADGRGCSRPRPRCYRRCLSLRCCLCRN
jgi:N-acyl-D-aspartate/D-glutamate deacylase